MTAQSDDEKILCESCIDGTHSNHVAFAGGNGCLNRVRIRPFASTVRCQCSWVESDTED